MKAQAAHFKSIGGTGNPGQDPHYGLKDNLAKLMLDSRLCPLFMAIAPTGHKRDLRSGTWEYQPSLCPPGSHFQMLEVESDFILANLSFTFVGEALVE
jgi:hypothetical protein